MQIARLFSCIAMLIILTACGTISRGPLTYPIIDREAPFEAQQVALYALTLKNTGYRYGGKNPNAGLDCSGMVSHVYMQAIGRRLSGNAAMLAREGREVERSELRAGDLVFFNTLGRPLSHVGIYLGGGEFIHALNSRSGVRIDKMSDRYYASRFDTARTLFD
jgi:cell wall-associated NlpC family hydrolase